MFGVWVSVKPNPGTGKMVVSGRQEVLCLFNLASLGDETDGGITLGLTRHLFFCKSTPLWAALPVSSGSIAQLTYLPNLVFSSCESSFLL